MRNLRRDCNEREYDNEFPHAFKKDKAVICGCQWLSGNYTKSLSQMVALHYPVLERFGEEFELLFSTQSFLALDPKADSDHVMWLYVDKKFTKARVVNEKKSWDANAEVMVDTELPGDQFDGTTVDVYWCSLVQDRWSLVCQQRYISELSTQTKIAFESYLSETLSCIAIRTGGMETPRGARSRRAQCRVPCCGLDKVNENV